MNRGSPMRLLLFGMLSFGFNEAPIHESGKYPAAEAHSLQSGRFNEAPIHESGKSRQTRF